MAEDCPKCGTEGEVRLYLDEMSRNEPEATLFVVSDSLIAQGLPGYHCFACGTDYFENGGEASNRFISDGSGVSIKCRKCQRWVSLMDGLDSHVC